MKAISQEEIRSIQIAILNSVDAFCRKNNLKYSLAYGTLIGAVRHKGFIPWDDDIDIAMPRDDYEKLLRYLRDNADKYEHLELFDIRTCPEYPYMIARVSDNRYVIDVKNEKPYGMGVFIDIYPLDGLGQTEEEALKYGLKGDRLSSLCYQSTRKRYAVEITKGFIKKVIKFPAFLVAKMCGKKFFVKKLSKLAAQKNYEDCNNVGSIVWLQGGMKDIFKKEWYDNYVKVPYEKYEFRVPARYDEILTHIYGNYMELPPEEDRIGHHYYDAYEK